MRKLVLVTFFILSFTTFFALAQKSDFKSYEEYKIHSIKSYSPKSINTIWYKKPARDIDRKSEYAWMEYALPIGNGQLGAMIESGVRRDIVQFNEKTLWSGSKEKYGSYLNFGELIIDDLNNLKEVKDYYRSLSLDRAIAESSYKTMDNKTTYSKDYLVSYPAKAIFVRLSAKGKNKLNNRIILSSGQAVKTTYNSGMASFEGDLDLLSYAAKVLVKNTGGKLITNKNSIEVKGASEILIVLSAMTNYDAKSPDFTFDKSQIDEILNERIELASDMSRNQIYDDHNEAYREYYDRVNFSLNVSPVDIDTYELLNAYNDNGIAEDIKFNYKKLLEQIYFNYGRYLLISSSRGIDLPSNLQGIWNDTNTPPWSSDLHANINVQMNYWPAEALNMSELHLPLLRYIHNMAINHEQWNKNAINSGQTKGWTAFTENNIFGYHGPFAHNYVIANAWYCNHLWQHYLYTLDKVYLKNVAFPVMKSASEFWIERLIQDRVLKDGTWVAPNEYSPEHGPKAEDATAHAQQLIYDLFDNTLKAIEELEIENEIDYSFIRDLREKHANLDRGLAIETIDGENVLREWKYTSGETGKNDVQKHHRHMSHLMALYPLSQVTPDSKYFEAIKGSLNHRTDASTGWSMGWKINLWARALDGNRAYKILETALKHSESYWVDGSKGGVYYNLLDSHAPFQIDGNFGATAGIAEMLMQSHNGYIHILPALPRFWEKGHIKGMKAQGKVDVDIYWENARLSKAIIKPQISGAYKIRLADEKDIISVVKVYDKYSNLVKFEKIDSKTIEIPMTADEEYIITQ